MIFAKRMDARVIVDVQSTLVEVTGSFGLGRMTGSVRMIKQQAPTLVDITVQKSMSSEAKIVESFL